MNVGALFGQLTKMDCMKYELNKLLHHLMYSQTRMKLWAVNFLQLRQLKFDSLVFFLFLQCIYLFLKAWKMLHPQACSGMVAKG